jgi:hypothetical protein
MAGTMNEVKEQVDKNIKAKEYRDPTQTLPDVDHIHGPSQVHIR